MMKRRLYNGFVPVTCVVLAAMLILAYLGRLGATTAAQLEGLSARKTVIIDAGHGLPDGGATSCTGVLECSINLQIANRLKDLMHLLGMKVFMIRNDENSVFTEGETIAAKKISDLKYRAKVVNSIPDSILVSIHQNHFSDSRYHGAQVFYASSEGSKNLAKLIQSDFTRYMNPEGHRQSKPAEGVYLMKHIRTTGILVECGFLSNPIEEAKLLEEGYQQKICGVLACGILRYIQSTAA